MITMISDDDSSVDDPTESAIVIEDTDEHTEEPGTVFEPQHDKTKMTCTPTKTQIRV